MLLLQKSAGVMDEEKKNEEQAFIYFVKLQPRLKLKFCRRKKNREEKKMTAE